MVVAVVALLQCQCWLVAVPWQKAKKLANFRVSEKV